MSEYTPLSLVDLLLIAKIIENYLSENNVVLYYYCDLKQISRSSRNNLKEPQEYRSKLFDRMYERVAQNKDLIKNDIIVRDNDNIQHYISLLSTNKNKAFLTKISNEVEIMNDKQ